MDFSQKLISEFMNLGNVLLKDATVALQVYLELSEVKKYWDVDYKYDGELQLLYLTAKKNKSENASVFIPKCSDEDFSYHKLQNFLKLNHNLEINSMFLVFVTSDSTCVYYQISEGLCEPKDMNAKHLKLNKQEKRDADIRKHRNVINEAALCGLPVTIREPNS